jgi:hypothetical protein
MISSYLPTAPLVTHGLTGTTARSEVQRVDGSLELFPGAL